MAGIFVANARPEVYDTNIGLLMGDVYTDLDAQGRAQAARITAALSLTAEEVERLLNEKDLSNPREIAGERSLCDDLDHFYVTDAADRFAHVAERFLGTKPSKLEAVEVYGHDTVSKR